MYQYWGPSTCTIFFWKDKEQLTLIYVFHQIQFFILHSLKYITKSRLLHLVMKNIAQVSKHIHVWYVSKIFSCMYQYSTCKYQKKYIPVSIDALIRYGTQMSSVFWLSIKLHHWFHYSAGSWQGVLFSIIWSTSRNWTPIVLVWNMLSSGCSTFPPIACQIQWLSE